MIRSIVLQCNSCRLKHTRRTGAHELATPGLLREASCKVCGPCTHTIVPKTTTKKPARTALFFRNYERNHATTP